MLGANCVTPSKNAEIAYWLGEPFWDRGIMSEAIKQLCRDSF